MYHGLLYVSRGLFSILCRMAELPGAWFLQSCLAEIQGQEKSPGIVETRGAFVGRFVPWGISGTGYIISPLERIGSLWRRCASAKSNSLSLNFRLSSIRDNERQFKNVRVSDAADTA